MPIRRQQFLEQFPWLIVKLNATRWDFSYPLSSLPTRSSDPFYSTTRSCPGRIIILGKQETSHRAGSRSK